MAWSAGCSRGGQSSVAAGRSSWGVMRGKTVVYQATLGPPELYMLRVDNPRGAIVMDTSITGPPAKKGSTSVGLHISRAGDSGLVLLFVMIALVVIAFYETDGHG